MEKRRRKMVGRLDTSNPKPKWNKTIYLDGDVIRETIHDGNFSPSPQEPALVFIPAKFCDEITGMKESSENPTQYTETNKNYLATAFISKVEQQIDAVDIILDDDEYQASMRSRILINDNTIGSFSQDFQSYLEEYKGTSQIVVAATELETALDSGIHTIKVEYNGEESETMTFTVATADYMYFEAVEANSTVSMVSTLTTAPNLEYSIDGETWQEWQHTDQTEGGVTIYIFDTLTLTAVGDRVYLRGNNPNGLCNEDSEYIPRLSKFLMAGQLAAGGNIMSLLDKTMVLTEIPDYGFALLFGSDQGPTTSLITSPSMETITKIGTAGCQELFYNCTNMIYASDMPALENVGNDGCHSMYRNCTSLEKGFGMPSLEILGSYAFADMYNGCTFDMSDDGTTLNFAFPTPPIIAGSSYNYTTYYDIAQWMGNTNGFTTP